VIVKITLAARMAPVVMAASRRPPFHPLNLPGEVLVLRGTVDVSMLILIPLLPTNVVTRSYFGFK
jgi:hypothetical protein